MNLKKIIDTKLYNLPLSKIWNQKHIVINTINPHSYIIAKRDKTFAKALLDSDILLPDGIGIVIASRMLCKKKISKIAGADIHKYLLNYANQNYQKVFYLGASMTTLHLIERKIKREFPNISIKSFSPPFKLDFSEKDTHYMLSVINSFEPDILFVGMTAPKQEKWVFCNRDKIISNTIVSIGAVFDFYAGTVMRPHKFWIKIGLEWLPRFLKEPKRLWKRNLVSTPLFLYDIARLKYKDIFYK